MEWLFGIIGIVIGAIGGFIAGKVWKSRKIDSTVALAKEIAKDPSSAKDKIDQIAEIWK